MTVKGELARYARAYRHGDLPSLIMAVDLCDKHRLPLPGWAVGGVEVLFAAVYYGKGPLARRAKVSTPKSGAATTGHWRAHHTRRRHEIIWDAVKSARAQGATWQQAYRDVSDMTKLPRDCSDGGMYEPLEPATIAEIYKAVQRARGRA